MVLPQAEARLTVVYVHGFYTNVDDAWADHRLADQLAGDGLFLIAPEAPSGPGEDVAWPDLDSLLAEVESRAGVAVPQTVIAIGHSGAYRTVSQWTASRRLASVALLDAFYGAPQTWDHWLARDPAHQLYVLARHTAERSKDFCARHAGRVTCEASKWSHMGIVTKGEALPRVVLRLVAHSVVAEAPYDV